MYSVVNCFYPLKTKKTLLCIAACSYIIAMYTSKLPNKRSSLLDYFRQYADKDVFKDLAKVYDKEPHQTAQGLLGNYIMRELTPDNLDIDLIDKKLSFSPTDNFNLGVGKRGDTNFLNLGWRF